MALLTLDDILTLIMYFDNIPFRASTYAYATEACLWFAVVRF